MQNVTTKNKIIIFLGITLFISGIIFLSSNYLNEKVDYAYSYMNNLLLERNEEIYEIQEEVGNISEPASSFKETEKVEYKDPYLDYYIGSIEIPKINLNKGWTAIDSPYNTVNKNIQVVNGSTYPDVEGGNFILAAHSGTSYLAYFRNLYQLTNGDLVYINYNNVKYTYKLVNSYQQEKTGKIIIYRDGEKTTLTLVTCTKNSKTEQTIYILELVNKENI